MASVGPRSSMNSVASTPAPAHALEVTPDSVLSFALSTEEAASKCGMTVRHPGGDKAIAFKVKTTQPRRYLVRPNQGLVRAGQSESVSILLVEKDKLSLLSAYERVGPTALEHSKDKFLVQSCPVEEDFANLEGKALAESLTAMWNRMGSRGGKDVYNKKLHVKHVMERAPKVVEVETGFENMSPQQIYGEISSLRRKYDELVTFSVNLTAERDVLQNSLEQTKTELDRAGSTVKEVEVGGIGSLQIFAVALAAFLVGSILGKAGLILVLERVPIVGGYLVLLLR